MSGVMAKFFSICSPINWGNIQYSSQGAWMTLSISMDDSSKVILRDNRGNEEEEICVLLEEAHRALSRLTTKVDGLTSYVQRFADRLEADEADCSLKDEVLERMGRDAYFKGAGGMKN